MRLGELVGLMWQDLDFEGCFVTINRNLNRLKNYDEESKDKTIIVIGEPKTKNSKRVIPLADNIIKDLRLHSKRQKEQKLRLGEGYNDQGFIFASPLGECIEPRTMQDAFKRILAFAEVSDANFHSMRHTFATRALEAGVPAKIVSEILGHASVSFTLDQYSHVSLDVKRGAINKINAYVASQD